MPLKNDEARQGGDLARAPGVCLAADSSENKAALPLLQASWLSRRLKLSRELAAVIVELAFQQHGRRA
jgi:hypothetical protein